MANKNKTLSPRIEMSESGRIGTIAPDSEDFQGIEPQPNGGSAATIAGRPPALADSEAHQPVGNEQEAAAREAFVTSVGEAELPSSSAHAFREAYEAAYAEVDEQHLLDAWYATFATPATRAIMQQERLEGRMVPEVVIGVDDRVQVTATTQYPWRAISSLQITANNGTRWIGTGWFAGPRLVVTAGHCVFMASQGGWVRSIEVIPGRNGAQRPYGSRVATTFRSVSGWTVQNDREFDYGAILLTGGSAPGSQVGHFGFGVRSDQELMSYTTNVSGYPGDKPVGTQWWHARRVDRVTPKTFFYQIDTAGGQSGAPVWVYLNGSRTALGIHTNGAISGNSATRINQEVFNNLKRWKDEAGQ